MDTLTPMADLATKWGITANTVSRRLAFLGIKPERQGNLRYITADQLALGDDLQGHIISGKPMELFRIVNKPEGGLVTRRVRGWTSHGTSRTDGSYGSSNGGTNARSTC